jgi:hypothetical protein
MEFGSADAHPTLPLPQRVLQGTFSVHVAARFSVAMLLGKLIGLPVHPCKKSCRGARLPVTHYTEVIWSLIPTVLFPPGMNRSTHSTYREPKHSHLHRAEERSTSWRPLHAFVRPPIPPAMPLPSETVTSAGTALQTKTVRITHSARSPLRP